MGKKSKDNTEINTSRRSSEPDNSKNKIHTLTKRQNTDNTNQSVKKKHSSFFETVRKNLLNKKKENDKKEDKDNADYPPLAPSSSEDEISEKEESSIDSTVSDYVDNISEYNKNEFQVLKLNDQDEIIDELKIKFDIKITTTRNNTTSLKTIIIEKNNSEALTREQANSIFKTGIGYAALRAIGKNKDEDPIRIVYKKNIMKNLNDFSVKMYEIININNQGNEIISHANYDLNELKALINSESNNAKAIIKNELSSPEVAFTALPFIDSDDKECDSQERILIIDINEDSAINISGETVSHTEDE